MPKKTAPTQKNAVPPSLPRNILGQNRKTPGKPC